MKLGSLFTGYGGLDMAVSGVFDAHPAWVSDVEPGPQAILSERFPGVPNLGDITTVDWDTVADVDVIVGGSPCQDLSTAGQRKGMKPGTRSGLWESMWHAVEKKKPALVVWENVQGAYSADAFCSMEPGPGCVGNGPDGPVLRALGRVLGDLSSVGYDAAWTSLRASDVGAPHSRERVFVVAYPHREGRDWHQLTRRSSTQVTQPDGRVCLLPGFRGLFGDYGPAIDRWAAVLGRPPPVPVSANSRGTPQLDAAFTEWLMGLPAGWVTQVPGLTRAEQLRALGNGVVPQQAAAAIRLLAETNRTEREKAL